MLKLPFKTESKKEVVAIGDENIGVIEMPKLGDLSANERLFIRVASKDIPNLRQEAVKLAKDIASKTNRPLIEAYNALTGGNAEELSEYLEEFLGFQEMMEEASAARQPILATAVLRRLSPDWTLDDSGNADQIHPKLLKLVAEFAAKEEAGWQEAEPVTEEDLGKSEEQKNLIGEKSSGE